MQHPLERGTHYLINISDLAQAVALELKTTDGIATAEQRILTLNGAAGYCGLSRGSFKKKAVRDQIRKVRIDKRWRFDRAELDVWIESHKDQNAQETAA